MYQDLTQDTVDEASGGPCAPLSDLKGLSGSLNVVEGGGIRTSYIFCGCRGNYLGKGWFGCNGMCESKSCGRSSLCENGWRWEDVVSDRITLEVMETLEDLLDAVAGWVKGMYVWDLGLCRIVLALLELFLKDQLSLSAFLAGRGAKLWADLHQQEILGRQL